ncbi:MAG: aminofutalosine synthase MqnE [Betaproteobacteria bacterium]|nr:aminofutalosine synthase MqnE [Betaproteobacteria bacterium]
MESVTCRTSHVPPSPIAGARPRPDVQVSYTQIQSALTRALRGERLSFEDGVNLYHSPDLLELAAVANELNLRKNGRDVFFNVNRHINPTNICALSCKFCAFSRKPGEEGAYAYSEDEIAHRAKVAADSGATEVHMVGGLHPRWKLANYTNIIRTVKETAPQLHVKAFTAVELDWLARKERKTVAELLGELRAAGLGSLPGGGAEIFAPYIREKICDTKLTGEGWLDIHRTAHKMGLRSNCTMLYGHIEDVEARVDHMMHLRDLQEETRGFNVFIPLAYQPENNELGINRHTYGVDDLKTIAIARLMLDNFQHIKSYWVMTGDRVAQTALHYGANDLDGTVVEEKIANMAGSRAGMAMAKSKLLRVIRDADRIPVERSTVYEPIRRYDNPAEDMLQ